MKKNYNFSAGLVFLLLLVNALVFGQNKYAIGLDGGESMYIKENGSNHSIDVTSAWTFEAWINVASYTSGDYDCIMDRRHVFSFYLIDDDDDDYAIAFVARNSSDAIIAYIDCDGTGSTSANMNYGTWYHVAATYDGTTAKLYVNSTLCDSDTDSDFVLSADSYALNIGGRFWGSYTRQMTDAQIDEVRVSDVARDISDMQTDTHWEEYSSDENTVILMHLNDEANPPTYISGTGFDGESFDQNITAIDYTDTKLGTSYYLLRPKYESQKTGNWSDLDTWKVEHGANNYVNATILPDQYTESITIKDGHTVTSNGDDVVIASSGKLEIEGSLTVDGTLTNNAENTGLILKSTASIQGSLINSTSNVGATVERYIAAYTNNTDGWHLLSSPVDGFSISGSGFEPTTGDDDLYYWDETQGTVGEWINYDGGSFTTFEKGKGYACAYKSAATKEFSGDLNVSDVTFTNLSADHNRWHLLGNPFTCALDWSQGTWNETDVSVPQVYDESKGDHYPINSGTYDSIIPSTQGFFVEVNDATNAITIPADARVHNATAWYKSAQSHENTLCLKLSGGHDTYSSQTTIVFDPTATNGYDIEFDSHKILGASPAPKVYTVAGNDENFAVNYIPPTEDEVLIPTQIRVFSDGEYTIDVIINTVEREGDIYLEDLKTGMFTNLSTTDSYTFTASEQDDEARFMLHFNSATGTDDMENAANVNIYARAHTIYLNSQKTMSGNVMIYDMGGKLVASHQIHQSNMYSIPVNNLNNGVYLVHFVETNGVSVQKVMIQ